MKKLWLLVPILILANLFVWLGNLTPSVYGSPHSVFGHSPLKVAFLNVGQGDAIYIETPHGRQVLIDGGPDKSVLRELGSVMPAFDRSLDLVLESHADSDHIGGLPDVLERFSVNDLVRTGNLGQSKLFTTLDSLAGEKHDTRLIVHAGERIILEPGIYLDILSPTGDPAHWETNRASLVAKLTYASSTFLFTGDVDESVEKYLTKVYGKNLHVDVLKVSHHGSRNSNLPTFLTAIAPKYAVISVGAGNKFGHPHQEVLDSLAKLKSQILRTDQVGAVVFVSDGEVLSVDSE